MNTPPTKRQIALSGLVAGGLAGIVTVGLWQVWGAVAAPVGCVIAVLVMFGCYWLFDARRTTNR
jgi:hypothetical protein